MNKRFREVIESFTRRKISDVEFKEVMQMITDDIKFNRIGFKKKTSWVELSVITTLCAAAYAGPRK